MISCVQRSIEAGRDEINLKVLSIVICHLSLATPAQCQSLFLTSSPDLVLSCSPPLLIACSLSCSFSVSVSLFPSLSLPVYLSRCRPTPMSPFLPYFSSPFLSFSLIHSFSCFFSFQVCFFLRESLKCFPLNLIGMYLRGYLIMRHANLHVRLTPRTPLAANPPTDSGYKR